MYEDRIQNHDPEIHEEEYLIYDTPISLPHHVATCSLQHSYKHN